jgi:hypothetical protein
MLTALGEQFGCDLIAVPSQKLNATRVLGYVFRLINPMVNGFSGYRDKPSQKNFGIWSSDCEILRKIRNSKFDSK